MSSIARKRDTLVGDAKARDAIVGEAVIRMPLEAKKALPAESEAGDLPATIRLFQNITSQLTDSYETLTRQVESLRGELALADQALSKEVHAKESISERMERLLAAMPVAVITLDANGFVDDANPSACELLGRDIVSRRWVNVIGESFVDTTVCGSELLLKSGRVVSIATQPLSERGGQVVVLTDLTETRRLQNKINHLEKLSEMGRMMASLAHQIRTPLSSAMIFAEHLVGAEKAESRSRRYASRVMEKLTQLDRQVKDMLIFSKSGFLMNDRVKVCSLVEQLAESASEILDAHGGELQMENTCMADVSVVCNRPYLISGFCNLVENAIQACQESGIVPSIAMHVDCSSASMLTVDLHDNGPGFAADKINKVLEPFFTTKANGTGLGLPVVYAIVSGHGGAMDIYNRPEGGAGIRIQLPLADSSKIRLN